MEEEAKVCYPGTVQVLQGGARQLYLEKVQDGVITIKALVTSGMMLEVIFKPVMIDVHSVAYAAQKGSATRLVRIPGEYSFLHPSLGDLPTMSCAFRALNAQGDSVGPEMHVHFYTACMAKTLGIEFPKPRVLTRGLLLADIHNYMPVIQPYNV